MLKELVTKIFDKIAAERAFIAILSGLVLATLLTLIVGFLLEVYQVISVFPWVSIQNTEAGVILFGTSFFAFTFILYFVNYKEREDILTPLRKQLKGVWRVVYEDWKIEDEKLVSYEDQEHCVIGIDSTTAKLFFRFNTIENQIWGKYQDRIDDVTINPGEKPKRMTYYHDVTIKLSTGARDKLGTDVGDVSGPIFGILRIKENDDGSGIDLLEGNWYDLDGTFARMRESLFRASGMNASIEVPKRGAMRFERIKEEGT